MEVPTTLSSPEVVVNGAKQIKLQKGFWIRRILYKFFFISRYTY